MNAVVYGTNGSVRVEAVPARAAETYVEYSLSKDALRGADRVEFSPESFTARAGDEGYMLSSGGIALNTTLLYFRSRNDFTYEEEANVMPVMGIRRNGNAVFLIAVGMDMAFRARYRVQDDRYSMTACFILNGDEPYEDVSFRLYEIPDGTYNEMARLYRDYQIVHARLVPLRERVRERPELAYAAESMEFRIRMGWKPSPSPIPHQSPDREPPMLVACDFERVVTILERMKAAGIKKAEICLVGWNKSGHDGRFPQLFPPEPLLGGEAGLKKVIRAARDAGYAIVCHDNDTGAYECAENWDEEFIAKDKDGALGSYHSPNLSGGICYRLCPRRAREKFAARRLPMLQALGFRGLHFIDVFTARPSNRCYDARHPVNYAQCKEAYLAIMDESIRRFGGFQSEGPFDFLAEKLDYCLYTSFRYRVHNDPAYPQCDEMIPFWELVYHGYILSSPGAENVNFPIKGREQTLFLAECGGRPAMYLYSKFGKDRNWMGDLDLRCESEEELEETVRALKAAADWQEAYGRLQYETMERHEKLSETRFRVTYSDGTTVVTDYGAGTYEILPGKAANP